MTKTGYDTYPCAICDGEDFAPIDAVQTYTNGQLLHACKACGLVQAISRRSAQEIAKAWSEDVFAETYTKHTYTAKIPHVLARQTFVAATIDDALPLKGKSLCDIGAGEGQFLEIVRQPEYDADVFGVEPSTKNCQLMSDLGIENFAGSVGDFHESPESSKKKFDIVTIMWTLEACSDPRDMLDAAHGILNEGGHVVIATGSRIMVPFKKPMQYFMGSGEPVDQHPFDFSHNTLEGMLAVTGFKKTYVNRYIDNDVLCMIAQKRPSGEEISWQKDDYQAVIDFFSRWHEDTKSYYTDY